VVDAEIERGHRTDVEEVVITKGLVFSLGEHEFTIRVHRISGEVLEYSWTFTVVAEEPLLPGLPDVLQFVRPLPDSTITLRAYREEQLIPYYYAPRFPFDFRQSVCAGLHPRRIEEIEESRDANEVSDKYAFVALDGVPPEPDAPIWNDYNVGEIYHYDETGDIIVETLVGWHCKCWWVDLAPGEHEATVRVEKASGEVIEYAWWFTITSD
jgi:hypothetical protein